ncbi:InlB B-repeat-containing protein [Bifidobacterium ruminantium]|uniref:InlB B-repeat-containing protein n=1 Tax=Bifidobacterium ruminantium TaxID=78346 RepID=UPI001956E1D2|nr:InlB B-repeat-containing protein [Bifidobacterium ruminantium]MBM6746403.1 InlB B-repeat-containing protein [Bifidobacterium ruminantium]
MGFLTRLLAGLVAASTLGAGLTGTANAVDTTDTTGTTKSVVKLTADDTNNLPDHIVNGDFSVNYHDQWKDSFNNWTSIDPNTGKTLHATNTAQGSTWKWTSINGWNRSQFGWTSTQKAGSNVQQKANAVELQYDDSTADNVYAELCAYEAGTAIYQDIRTTPGTLYKVRLKHASLNSTYLDKMQVMIGTPGHEQPVEMTRTSVNGHGDKLNEKSTTIATKVTNGNNRHHADQWETYEGTYLIPDGQTTTRFTFKSIDSKQLDYGNVLDDIVFDKAYRLNYDKNASDATGKVPSNQRGKENTVQPAKTKTNGKIRLASDTSKLSDHLVNSDFEYLPDGGWKTVDAPSYMTNAYTSVDPNNGQYMRNAQHSDAGLAWVDWPGFDRSKFAWRTDQKGGQDQGGLKDRANAVELQQDNTDGNAYAEMVASETGRTIYQDLATIPGTLYKIRLKHASLCKDNVDKMQVVINGTPIEMTRVTANGKAGDKVGEKSTTIATKVTNENRWHHADQWETYEGYYVIPDGQTTTRFGFKAVNYLDPTKGNLLDDVTFARAYKLSYDKNSTDATGEVPSNQRGKENTTQPARTKTNGTVKTVAEENAQYGSLANGDFSYPSFSDIQKNEQENAADLRTFIKSDDGTLWYNMSSTDLSKYRKIGQIPGFDSSRFAWSSTENGSRVELQQDRNTKNTYAEIVAQQDNTSIYQNVSTGNGGVLYKIRLKHASRQSSHADRMQVLVGSDTAHATPVEMTRVTSNGHGDKVGGKSTTITTKVSNTDPRDHGSQWETYEGYYQVPEGQKNTVFMFKSLEGFKEYETLSGNNIGNLVDDIEFSRSYKLTYDKNAQDATGSVPSSTTSNTVQAAKADATGTVRPAADINADTDAGRTVQHAIEHEDGSVTVKTIDTSTDVVSGCQVYYPAGQRITLATMAKDDDCWDSSMLSRPGHTQLGWNQDRNATAAQPEVTMVEGGMTVYAVWVGNPVLTYDTNKPSTWGGQMPSTPASVSVPYNTAATDKSGWAAGDTSKIRGYRFLGWYTGPQDNAGLYDWTRPLTGSVTVYAHWQRLQANVVYNANGGTGSHANTTGWQYSDVTIPGDTSKSFTRTGYRFAGWNTAKDGKGTAYVDGSKVPLQAGDVTLYAQWKPLFDVLPSAGGDYGPSVPWLVCGGLALVALAGGVASTLLRLRRARGAHSR